jgi:hypothetical protein
MNLTQQSVETAKPPAKTADGKHTFSLIHDDRVRGFALRILDSGTKKTFLLAIRIKGKLSWLKIGRLSHD